MKKHIPFQGHRPLTLADKNIWQRVAKTVRPLAQQKLIPGARQEPQSAGSHIHLPPTPSPVLHHTASEIQIRAGNKIRKGKLEIDRKIDLHDFTRDQAFPVLKNQLTRAYMRNMRTVLVVTGKGPNLEGVLRKSLPTWLAAPEIRPLIGDYAPAHIRHGGAGAFYVFLKKK